MKKPASFLDGTFTRLHLRGEVGLFGKFLDATAVEEFSVQCAIHVPAANRPSNWRVSDLATEGAVARFSSCRYLV